MRQFALLVLVILLPFPSSAEQLIYTYARPTVVSTEAALYQLDPLTGSSLFIGPNRDLISFQPNELSIQPGDQDAIYGTIGSGGPVTAIARIDRYTGDVTLKSLSPPRIEFDEAIIPMPKGWQPNGFAIDPLRPTVAEVLGLSALLNGSFIYEVDLETGMPLTQAIKTSETLRTIAFSPDGSTLFATRFYDGPFLGTLNPTSGVFSEIGGPSIDVLGLEFDQRGSDLVAVMSPRVNVNWDMVRIDPRTGAITQTITNLVMPDGSDQAAFGVAIVDTPELSGITSILFALVSMKVRRTTRGQAMARLYTAVGPR